MKFARKPLKQRFDRCPSCLIGGLTRGVPALDGRPSFKCARCGNHFTNGKNGGEYAAHVPAGFVSFGDVMREHFGGQTHYLDQWGSCPAGGEGLRFDGGPCDYHNLKIHSDDVMELVRRLRERGVTGG